MLDLEALHIQSCDRWSGNSMSSRKGARRSPALLAARQGQWGCALAQRRWTSRSPSGQRCQRWPVGFWLRLLRALHPQELASAAIPAEGIPSISATSMVEAMRCIAVAEGVSLDSSGGLLARHQAEGCSLDVRRRAARSNVVAGRRRRT